MRLNKRLKKKFMNKNSGFAVAAGNRLHQILCGVVGAMFGVGLSSGHGAVTSFVVPSGRGNSYIYSYAINNQGSFPIVGWSLNFSGVVDWNQNDEWFGGDVQTPPDWVAQAGIPLPGWWAAQDFFSLGTFDVPVGGNFGWFSFRSSGKPGRAEYVEFGASGESSIGETRGPMPPTLCSPESGPGLVALGTVAGLVLAGGTRRR